MVTSNALHFLNYDPHNDCELVVPTVKAADASYFSLISSVERSFGYVWNTAVEDPCKTFIMVSHKMVLRTVHTL